MNEVFPWRNEGLADCRLLANPSFNGINRATYLKQLSTQRHDSLLVLLISSPWHFLAFFMINNKLFKQFRLGNTKFSPTDFWFSFMLPLPHHQSIILANINKPYSMQFFIFHFCSNKALSDYFEKVTLEFCTTKFPNNEIISL